MLAVIEDMPMIKHLAMLPLLATLWVAPAAAATVKTESLPFPATHDTDIVVGYINSCRTSSDMKVVFKNGVNGVHLKEVNVTASAHLGKTASYRPGATFSAMVVSLEINCPFDPPGMHVSITVRDFASKTPLMSVGLAP